MGLTPNAERDAFIEDVEWMVANGCRERELMCTRLGLTVDNFERRLQRWGRPDLIERTYRYSEV